ncbi:MAG: IS1380 family transposase [Pseudonocardiaceae bacterium]
MELSAWSKDLMVEVAGHGVVSHAGSAVVRMIADGTGLTAGLSRALSRRGFVPVHDRGRVLADTAVLIADGGRVLSDLATLRDQGELFGPVASDPTLWRALSEIGPTQRDRIARARAKTRAHVWTLIEQRPGRIPPSRVGDRDLGKTIVVRMDASILISHSDKEQAAGTFKHTFGHHPLGAWCDNTSELAFQLRPGNAGSNTAADHIVVLTEALAQIPARYRRDVLVPVDGAGATLDLVRHITTLNAVGGRRVHYSVGFDLDERARTAIATVPQGAWAAVSDTDGALRDLDDTGVVELTGLLRKPPTGDRLASWPADMRIICRRERPSAGAQLSLFEAADGWRYQLIATNTPTGQPVFLEARHRPHARVEDNIRCAKDTGIEHLPSKSYETNQAWCVAAMIACDLLCWLRLLCLDGPLAKAEPKTLRYRLLHTAVRLVRGQRKRKIKIPAAWPWARELEACFLAVFALVPP